MNIYVVDFCLEHLKFRMSLLSPLMVLIIILLTWKTCEGSFVVLFAFELNPITCSFLDGSIYTGCLGIRFLTQLSKGIFFS